MGDPHCGNSATVAAYKTGIPYAVSQLGTLAPGVTMYLDAAHGGWLGWENNMADFATLINSLDITQYVRGFATNTANYQPLGVPCPAFDWCLNNQHPDDACCSDPCDLLSQYNPSNNEHNYVLQLANSFASFNPGFLIDTGRNGVPNARSNCANWCNIRNSGAGTTPSTNTSYAAIDAYYWLKTPGESDGCTQNLPNGTACARFDSMCASVDSIGSEGSEPRAPTAGAWFDYMVQMLAKNAQL
jgi:cellulose 1,4-beta-cellobiosidase